MQPEYIPHVPYPEEGRRRPWVLIAIVIAAVAGIVALVVLLIFAVNDISAWLEPEEPPQMLESGDPGPPVAVESLECDGPCFEEKNVDQFLTDDAAFGALGLDSTTAPWGFYDSRTVGQLYAEHLEYWAGFDSYTPDNCIFVPSIAPYISHRFEGSATSLDPVHFLVTHEDKGRTNLGDMSARLFESTWAASSYLRDLSSSVESCTYPVVGYRKSVTITPMPALDLPDSVAATGWVSTDDRGDGSRVYIADLQRGNAVVRIRVVTDGAITEQEFHSLVEDYASGDLALVAPTGRIIPS